VRQVSKWSRLKDVMIAHPGMDVIPSAATAIAVYAWQQHTGPFEAHADILTGTSTAGAFVLAAASFAAATVYGSTAEFMVTARHKFHRELSRNWMSILGWVFVATIAPLIAMFLPQEWSITTVSACLMILTVKFARSMFWFRYTLTLDVASEQTPRVRVLRPASDLERHIQSGS
jgi:hypothetical protein